MREPRRDHYRGPATGPDTHAALNAALQKLCVARNLHPLDTTATLHLLASLATETHNRLAMTIADARHHQHSWAEIADLLGVTRASAWQRWAPTITAAIPPSRPK